MSDSNSVGGAGWYKDPEGIFHHRYFDGLQWTEHVSMNGVQSKRPLAPSLPGSGGDQDPRFALQRTPPTGYILTIGDIGVSPDFVVTPNGSGPLAGSQWICSDMTRVESKIPAWAIVLAIIFAFLCLVGLLFLLVKEKTVSGYVEVSVRSGSIFHKTQIPVFDEVQVRQIRQLVNQAQVLAAQASQGGFSG